MASEFRFTNLDEFEKMLMNMAKEKMPQVVEQKLYELAFRLQTNIKARTPIDTTRLRDSFVIGDIVKNGDEWYIEVGTNVDYSLHIEYGHRIVNKDKETIGFVKGFHMVQVSMKQLERELPNEVSTWLQEIAGALM